MPKRRLTAVENNGALPTIFSERLVAVLAQRGLTQFELAGRVGVTRASVNDWCKGRATPGPPQVFAIEEALGIDPGMLSCCLGYLPVSVMTQRPRTTMEVIDADPLLDDLMRRILRLLYQELTRGG